MALGASDLAAQVLTLLKDCDAAADIFIEPTGKRDHIHISYGYSVYCRSDSTYPLIVVSEPRAGSAEMVERYRGSCWPHFVASPHLSQCLSWFKKCVAGWHS